MKIKVGHIYQSYDEERLVITYVNDYYAEFIWSGGTTGYIKICLEQNLREFFNNFRLIAKYPTWQEAVNSKEFNGELR